MGRASPPRPSSSGADQVKLDFTSGLISTTTVNTALAQLKKKARFDPESAREVIDHLTAGRFLQPG